VAIKVNCDLQLTRMASSLDRLLAVRVGNGYQAVKSRHRIDIANGEARSHFARNSGSGQGRERVPFFPVPCAISSVKRSIFLIPESIDPF
jgi:hypothetical protein